MNFNEDNKNENFENEVKEDKNKKYKGKFFLKKYIYLIVMFLAFLTILILFRKEFFSSNEVKEKKIEKNIPVQKAAEIENISYEGLSDIKEATYDNNEYVAEEADYDIEAYEPSPEELERMNKLKQLEQEAEMAMRSPTTISIAARPVLNNSPNININAQNKQVSDYDGNRQESKKNFLMNEAAQRFYQTNFLVEALSEYELKAGDFIPAIMVTGINSDLPSKVITAVVSENVRDTMRGNHILIPQGTKVIGVYDSSITFGQERLLVIWQRLILPNGKSLALDNMQGVDLSGQAGITGEVNNHFATLLKGVILSSFLGSAGAIASSNNYGTNDWRTAGAQGAGEQIVTIGDRFAERALSRQPTIIIKPGERFNIMVHSDLILEPYGE